jgi:ABC-2 type transport system ATP-binding protein
MNNTESALRISGLNKRFGDQVAVSDLSLDIPVGSFYGIVGPNGAGKTTTLNMATGILEPDSGNVQVFGVDVWANLLEAKSVMGVMPEPDQLFNRLTGQQLLIYTAMLRGMDRKTAVERSTDLLKVFDLTDAKDKMVTDYSVGMTKKIALGTALIDNPRLVILDEPFEGVDPVSSASLRDILEHYVKSGGTVIMSSHVMELVEKSCDHVAIINNGKVLAAGALDEVRAGDTLENKFFGLIGGVHDNNGELGWLDAGETQAQSSQSSQSSQS